MIPLAISVVIIIIIGGGLGLLWYNVRKTNTQINIPVSNKSDESNSFKFDTAYKISQQNLTPESISNDKVLQQKKNSQVSQGINKPSKNKDTKVATPILSEPPNEPEVIADKVAQEIPKETVIEENKTNQPEIKKKKGILKSAWNFLKKSGKEIDNKIKKIN